MRPLLTLTVLAFGGYSLLLPVSPLWATQGGAGEGAAGAATAVLMAGTILTQLVVDRGLRVLGWGRLMALALVLLAVPAPLQALTPDIGLVLFTSAVRGVGFGIVTVCGSSALALLVPPSHRGRAVGLYGLAVAVPQFVLASSAPALAEAVGTRTVLVLAVFPLAGLRWVLPLGRRLGALDTGTAPRRPLTGLLWPTLLPLLLVTSASGALLTFASQIARTPTDATAALLGLTGLAMVARWAAGAISDRLGPRALIPLLGAGTALGLAGLAGSLAGPGNPALLPVGASVLGIAYGGLQSATLVRAFERGGPGASSRVSVLWNLTFDLGTGAGALTVGGLAQATSFLTALSVMAVVALAGAVVTARRA